MISINRILCGFVNSNRNYIVGHKVSDMSLILLDHIMDPFTGTGQTEEGGSAHLRELEI